LRFLDLDIKEDDTLYPFFRNAEIGSLAYAVRETRWDQLYLVPANLKLYSAEYEPAARIARTEPALLNRLADGIASIRDHFDVVILDPPPALGTISLAVMRAANAAAGRHPTDGRRLHLDDIISRDAVRDDAHPRGESSAG
jgi:chromosome partitioning protein